MIPRPRNLFQSGDLAYTSRMGENNERCTKCGHPLGSHEPVTGCIERVPGTMERMPGPCTCGAPGVLADVIPFRSRNDRTPDSAT
jgi:hypothetical protein